MSYQKYYKNGQQDPYGNPPQSPFDVAYGSSLLPRQLLVSSPYIQVPTPLNSPYGRPNSINFPNGYFVGPPVPQLNMPPNIRHPSFNQHGPETPSKSKSFRNPPPTRGSTSTSKSTSSLNDFVSEADESKDQIEQIDSNGFTSVSSNPLYNSSNSSNSANLNYSHKNSSFNLSSNSPNSNNFQVSKNPTRSIILINVNPDLTITEFLNSVTFGPIENIRLLPNSCLDGLSSIVLTFLKTETCLEFYKSLSIFSNKFKKTLNSEALKVSFITSMKLLSYISHAIDNDGATRNVFIGNLNSLGDNVDEEFILKEFKKYGAIDKIDILEKGRPKKDDEKSTETAGDVEKCAFIHFTNIASAIKTVGQLNLNPLWSETSIFYGTDRCSAQADTALPTVEETQESITTDHAEEFKDHDDDDGNGKTDSILFNYDESENYDDLEDEDDEYDLFGDSVYHPYSDDQLYGYTHQPPRYLKPYGGINDNFVQSQSRAVSVVQNIGGDLANAGNRTICLSNIDPATSVEDICNVVRGGVLQRIKYFPEKRVCFITFIETSSATHFFAQYQLNQLTLQGKRIRVGWGTNPGALPTKISLAVTVGASRNVYIGIKRDEGDAVQDENSDLQLPTEEELREDFEQFGEIEQINYFKNNSCVFLNFLNISNAIKLVTDANGEQSQKFHDHFKRKYVNLKISYGKDRCGNPPKAKKKKSKKNRNNKKRDIEANGEAEQTSETGEDIPTELFASMGITHKKDVDNEIAESKAEIDEKSIDTFGISLNSNKVTTSSQNKEISKTNSEDIDNEDDEDSDSGIEIITQGDDDSLEPEQHQSNDEYFPNPGRSFSNNKRTKSYSRNSSRNSSRASLNSYYSDYMPHNYQVPNQQQLYHLRQQQPQPPQPLHHHHHQQQRFANRQYNSTNGSQVMAQYLQQSQHANLLYAANVLSVMEEGDYGYYDTGYNNGPSRVYNRHR